WTGCLDKFDASDDARPVYLRGPLTRYGVAKDIQQLLAGIRTDLDSFTDVEAFALMTSGYRMTEYQFNSLDPIDGFSQSAAPLAWDFLQVETGMKGGAGNEFLDLTRQLSVSHMLAFKIWVLCTPLKVLSWLLGIVAVVLAVWSCFHWGPEVIVPSITLW